MATLRNLKPGQVLHDYHKQQQGNTLIRREGHWLVRVIEIDLASGRALCSWNNNPPRWMSEKQIKAFRVAPKQLK